MKPRENCNISFYKYPNEISQDLSDRAWNVPSMVKFLDHKGETMTCGSPYNVAMLNTPKKHHLRKTLISPNFGKTHGVGKGTE